MQKYNESHLSKINQLLALSEKKSVYLIFLLTPRQTPDSYAELLPLFRQMNKYHKIQLADTRQYADFYDPEASFDRNHLDGSGSVLFSKRLARKMKKLLREAAKSNPSSLKK